MHHGFGNWPGVITHGDGGNGGQGYGLSPAQLLAAGLPLPQPTPADQYATAAAVAQMHQLAPPPPTTTIGSSGLDASGLDFGPAAALGNALQSQLRMPYVAPGPIDLQQLLGIRAAAAPQQPAHAAAPVPMLEALQGLQGVVPNLLPLPGVPNGQFLPFLSGMPPLSFLPGLLAGAPLAAPAAAPVASASGAPSIRADGDSARKEGGSAKHPKSGARLVWTQELHALFLSAVNTLGGHERESPRSLPLRSSRFAPFLPARLPAAACGDACCCACCGASIPAALWRACGRGRGAGCWTVRYCLSSAWLIGFSAPCGQLRCPRFRSARAARLLGRVAGPACRVRRRSPGRARCRPVLRLEWRALVCCSLLRLHLPRGCSAPCPAVPAPCSRGLLPSCAPAAAVQCLLCEPLAVRCGALCRAACHCPRRPPAPNACPCHTCVLASMPSCTLCSASPAFARVRFWCQRLCLCDAALPAALSVRCVPLTDRQTHCAADSLCS